MDNIVSIADGDVYLSWNSNPKKIEKIIKINDIIQISGRDNHCLFLKKDGTIWSFGISEYGELGQGYTSNVFRDIPERIQSSRFFVGVYAGKNTSYFLTNEGEVFCCGRNDAYQLGHRSDIIMVTSPRKINNLTNIIAIYAGQYVCFFQDIKGNIFYSGIINFKYTTFDKPLRFKFSQKVVSIACGKDHFLFLTRNSQVYIISAIGNYIEDRFGIQGRQDIPVLTPIQDIIAIGANDTDSFFLTSSGNIIANTENKIKIPQNNIVYFSVSVDKLATIDISGDSYIINI